MDKTYTIAVTGHRPNKLWGYDMKQKKYDILKAEMSKTVYQIMAKEQKEHGTKKFHLINGGALGVDQIFCRLSIDLRDIVERNLIPQLIQGTAVTVEIAAPCLNHESKWPEESQDYYFDLMNACDKYTVVTQVPYAPYTMQKRNEYMVDKADTLIAVWDGQRGGTANCVRYAKNQGANIIQINPKEM